MNFSDLLPALDGAVADALCDDAIWEGVANAVRVQLVEEDELIAVGRSQIVDGGVVLQVRVAEVPQPAPLQKVVVGARTFELLRSAEPRRLADGTWWACEAREL